MKFYVKILIGCSCIFLIGKQKLLAQSAADDAQVSAFWGRSNLGISAGTINYAGRMNNKPFTFHNAKFAGELLYRYDFTDQFHVRGTLMVGALSGDHAGTFHTNIAEAAILPEYDFINMRVGNWNYHNRLSPYIYAGPSFYRLFHYRASEEAVGKTINLAAFNLRWGIGVKYAASPYVQLFFDASRREFSKSIGFADGDAPTYQSHYYTLMLGAVFNLRQRKHYKVNW